MKFTNVLKALVLALVCGAVMPAAVSAQSAEADGAAAKKVIEEFVRAFNARDVDRMMSYIAEDARIDSLLAGGQISKAKYREVVTDGIRMGRTAHLRVTRLKAVQTGERRVVFEGETYLQGVSGMPQGFHHRWALEMLDGRWLIVETKYK